MESLETTLVLNNPYLENNIKRSFIGFSAIASFSTLSDSVSG